MNSTYLADRYFDGVGDFPESTIQGRCKVCRKKHSYLVHKMQQVFAQIKRCHVMRNVPCIMKLIALIVLYRNKQL